MANPATRNVLKFKGAGTVQVFPNLPTQLNGSQNGSDVGTGGPSAATLETPVVGNFAANRNVEYLNDRYCLAFNNINTGSGVYKKNQGGAGLWSRVSGGTNSTPAIDGACTGLHVLHPAGIPTLAFLQRDANAGGSTRVRRTVDGITGSNWVETGLVIEAGGAAPTDYGQSIVYRNSIVWVHARFIGTAGTGSITQYDLVTATLTRYNVDTVMITSSGDSSGAFHVHNSKLFFP